MQLVDAPLPDSLEEKIAQLLFVRIGSNLPPIRRVADDEARVAELLAECPVGGLLLFNGQWPEVKDCLNRLQAASKRPLLVAADLERGAGQQVRPLTCFPHARAFAELGDEAACAVADSARLTAQQARSVGIHIVFAPVADVNTDPRNPIIATRAFSEAPDEATRLVASYVRAAQESGVLCVAKHFPGHGDTHQDSHETLPSVDRTIEQMSDVELAPFRGAMDAGVSMIMTAHVAYPRLDPSGAPATVSAPILHNLLRERLGFRGVVCSDSLLMAGVRDRYESEGEMACAALAAGVDLLLDVAEPARVVEHVARAVTAGEPPIERVDEALARVWEAKTRVLASPPLDASPMVTEPDAAALAERVARGAVKRWPESHIATPPPFDPRTPLAVCVLKTFQLPTDPAEQPLAEALRERFEDVRYFEFSPNAPGDDLAAALGAARESEQLLVALIVKPAAWHAFGLSPVQRGFVNQLLDGGGACALASLGVPTILDEFPAAKVRLCTYSDVPASQIALANFLQPAS